MALRHVTQMHCDFCGKSQHEVEVLISGPNNICICDQCVLLSQEIVDEAAAKKGAPAPVAAVAEQGAAHV